MNCNLNRLIENLKQNNQYVAAEVIEKLEAANKKLLERANSRITILKLDIAVKALEFITALYGNNDEYCIAKQALYKINKGEQ